MTVPVHLAPAPGTDLDWLLSVLAGRAGHAPTPGVSGPGIDARTGRAGAGTRYLVRPSLDRPRLLLPVDPAPVAAASLDRPSSDRSLADRAALVGARLLARVGRLDRVPGEVATLGPFPLIEHLGRVMGDPGLTAAVTVGPPRRNRKPVLQLLDPHGRVVGWAKIGWSPLTRDLVTAEADALTAAADRLPPWLIAPRLLLIERWGDLIVSVCSPLRPPRRPGPPTPGVEATAAALWAVGEEHRTPATTGTVLEGRLRLEHDPTPDPGPVRAALDRTEAHHGDLLLPTGLWHGDFTPWNMVARAGRRHLWDWEFAGHHRPRGFDLLHHRFEQLRRRALAAADRGPTAAYSATGRALDRLLTESDDIVATAARTAGDRPDRAVGRATVDLYLCELLVREHRLAGQRWDGGPMGAVGPVAADALDRRLGSGTASGTDSHPER